MQEVEHVCIDQENVMDDTSAVKLATALHRIAEQLEDLNKKLYPQGPKVSTSSLIDLIKEAHAEACKDVAQINAAHEQAFREQER